LDLNLTSSSACSAVFSVGLKRRLVTEKDLAFAKKNAASYFFVLFACLNARAACHFSVFVGGNQKGAKSGSNGVGRKTLSLSLSPFLYLRDAV